MHGYETKEIDVVFDVFVIHNHYTIIHHIIPTWNRQVANTCTLWVMALLNAGYELNFLKEKNPFSF